MVRNSLIIFIVAIMAGVGALAGEVSAQSSRSTNVDRDSTVRKTTRRKLHRRMNFALLRRLSAARSLAQRPRTFTTAKSVTVAARRAADEEKRKQDIINSIESQQFLRGADPVVSQDELRQIISSLQTELEVDTKPENAHEISYYIASCHEALGEIDQAKTVWQSIVTDYADSDDVEVKRYVTWAQRDLDRVSQGRSQQLESQ